MASFFVNKCTPMWIAPNTITLIGLCFMIVSYVLMWIYIPNISEGLESPELVPAWIFLFNAMSMVLYQTLDNMDGKQARRTESSSPLGLLFDHGCDAVNSIPGAVNWACAFGLSFRTSPMQAWFVSTCPMTLFYISTWEEYYTGTLVMPIINGPNEGLLAGASFSVISYLWGVSYWHGTTWYDDWLFPFWVRSVPSSIAGLLPENGLMNKDIIYWVCVIWLVQEETLKIYHVAKKYGVRTLKDLIPFAFLMSFSMILWTFDPNLVARNVRPCLHIVSGLFVEMSVQLMLDHMTKESFQPFRITLAPLAILVAMAATHAISDASADEFILGYMVGIWMYVLFKTRILIHEMSALLEIWCFNITKPWHAQ